MSIEKMNGPWRNNKRTRRLWFFDEGDESTGGELIALVSIPRVMQRGEKPKRVRD